MISGNCVAPTSRKVARRRLIDLRPRVQDPADHHQVVQQFGDSSALVGSSSTRSSPGTDSGGSPWIDHCTCRGRLRSLRQQPDAVR